MRDGHGNRRNSIGGTTRRDVLAGLCASGLAGGFFSNEVAAALGPPGIILVTGTVYDGSAATGPQCARGIGGVVVSNGRDVTTTENDGSWRLPVRAGDDVFVVKPAHWRAAASRGHVSSLRYRDCSGNKLLHADFWLEPSPEPDHFDVLLVADTQASTREELSFVRRDLIKAAQASRAVFAIHHGDVMGDDLRLLPDYLAALTETEMPWHHCPGNHDMDQNGSDAKAAFATWRRLVGPSHYAFEFGSAVFILLNNVAPAERIIADKPYRGKIGQEQLQFVRGVLANISRDRLVVVSMHIPLASYSEPGDVTATTADTAELLAILAGHPHTISFSGHSHTTEHHYFGRSDGFGRDRPHHHHVLTAACGSWWSGERDAGGVPIAHSRDGSPRGHHILSVAGHKAATRFVAAVSPDAQMRVMLCETGRIIETAQICRDRSATIEIVANVFNGGPKTEVQYRLAGREPLAMQPVKAIDPYVAQSYARAPHLCKPWVAACRSSHIWRAPLPAGLSPGAHVIEVFATDESGTIHSDTLQVEIV